MHYSIVVLIRVYKQIRDSLFGHRRYVHLENDLRRNTTQLDMTSANKLKVPTVFRRLSSLRYSISLTSSKTAQSPHIKGVIRYSHSRVETLAWLLVALFLPTKLRVIKRLIDSFFASSFERFLRKPRWKVHSIIRRSRGRPGVTRQKMRRIDASFSIQNMRHCQMFD